MKIDFRCAALLVVFVLLAGCATWNFENEPVNNTSAYFAGKGVAIAVHSVVKADTTVPALEKRYDAFLTAAAGMEVVPPDMSIALYNDLAMILAREADDPYGLLSDLTFLLSQFGASFAAGDNKTMTGIAPIPKGMYDSFASGWRSGKFVYENELKE
jgi:Na+/H+ antiporter NhaD/arsenite permease-like protein